MITVHELREQLSEYAIEYAGARERLYFVKVKWCLHPIVEKRDLNAGFFVEEHLADAITTKRKFLEVEKKAADIIAKISKGRKDTYGKLTIRDASAFDDLVFEILVGGKTMLRAHAWPNFKTLLSTDDKI
jgi:hypothetical protein